MTKKRIRYSKEFKRNFLLSVMRGQSPKEALLASGFDLSEVFKNDKKYASKLFYKWKKEFFKNGKSSCLIDNTNTSSAQNNFLNFYESDCEDVIMADLKKRIHGALHDYKKLNLKLSQIAKNKY